MAEKKKKKEEFTVRKFLDGKEIKEFTPEQKYDMAVRAIRAIGVKVVTR